MVTHALDLYRFFILITLLKISEDNKSDYKRLKSVEKNCGLNGEIEVYFHKKFRIIVLCTTGSDWVNKTTASVIYHLTYFKTPKDWDTILHVKDGAPGTRDPSFKLMAEKSGREEFILGGNTSSILQQNDSLPNRFLQENMRTWISRRNLRLARQNFANGHSRNLPNLSVSEICEGLYESFSAITSEHITKA